MSAPPRLRGRSVRLVTMGIIPAAGPGSPDPAAGVSPRSCSLSARASRIASRGRAPSSEYLIERLILGGADRLCFVVGPDRSDRMSYYGGRVAGLPGCYVVQPKPVGLCDALFCATAFLGPREDALVGMPDTIWFPTHALRDLPEDVLSFVLFPVARPELFDAVLLDARGDVRAMEVKSGRPATARGSGVGSGRRPQHAARARAPSGTRAIGSTRPWAPCFVNAYVVAGGRAVGVRSGRAYVDVGMPDGYREAVHLSCTPRQTSKTRSPTAPSSRARPKPERSAASPREASVGGASQPERSAASPREASVGGLGPSQGPKLDDTRMGTTSARRSRRTPSAAVIMVAR